MEEENPPTFSLNEFARLSIILRDDEPANESLHVASGLELCRRQIDLGISQDSYWKTLSAWLIDKTVDSTESFSDKLDEVDSNARHLWHRGAPQLKDKATSVKSRLTLDRDRQVTSEKKDPRRFTLFLSLTSFSTLTIDSKRVHALFILCRLNSESPADSFLKMYAMLIEDGIKGLDEGFYWSSGLLKVICRCCKRKDLHGIWKGKQTNSRPSFDGISQGITEIAKSLRVWKELIG